jgi:REP element-mobilizing transposase RayT
MPYNPDIHHRRSIRLAGYDYSSAGAYFITLCTHNRECLFGDIIDGKMSLSPAGSIVDEEWVRSGDIRREIELDAWVIMPNHIHGIIFIVEPQGDAPKAGDQHRIGKMGGKPKSLSSLVIGFKSACTKKINVLRGTPDQPVWQRDLYESIIGNERDLNARREYIALNPLRWAMDEENPQR